ncbi:uncharacterized protein LOC115037681 isoform X2 [Echeneis naucrates]|uniref:Uncharacterized LOC115037681 n=1 Tax=Echeneis naucrates TaxID=173247 RepID=A0A665VTK9_ECHNA|nr:uncharacterized protein LOC115037681 isoform X2 [Echeneis naucrates]
MEEPPLYVNTTEVKLCHFALLSWHKQARQPQCAEGSWGGNTEEFNTREEVRGSQLTAMPRLTGPAVLQLVLLLSAVPAQYLLTRWSGASAAQRYHATTRMLRIWKEWRSSYLNSTAWTTWANQQMSHAMSLVGLGQGEEQAHMLPPVETMLYDNDLGFFGASKTVRSPRPPYVFLRVGEVVLERKGNMVGVVVSWDPELKAPQEWINKMYSSSEGVTAERTPHYKVLFSGPGPSSLLVAYLPQTQLERITGMRPDIPTLEHYFTHFDGERFVMQPWLRELFPEDEINDA